MTRRACRAAAVAFVLGLGATTATAQGAPIVTTFQPAVAGTSITAFGSFRLNGEPSYAGWLCGFLINGLSVNGVGLKPCSGVPFHQSYGGLQPDAGYDVEAIAVKDGATYNGERLGVRTGAAPRPPSRPAIGGPSPACVSARRDVATLEEKVRTTTQELGRASTAVRKHTLRTQLKSEKNTLTLEFDRRAAAC